MRVSGVLNCIYSGGCLVLGIRRWEVGDLEDIHAAVTVPRAVGGWCRCLGWCKSGNFFTVASFWGERVSNFYPG